jgi:hypothetical protein
MNDKLQKESDGELRALTASLSQFLQEEPTSQENIERIIAQCLQKQTKGRDNARVILDSLSLYLGQENAHLLLGLIKKSIEEPGFLQTLMANIDADVWKLIRILAALYGNSIKEAYSYVENPHGWQLIVPKINYEIISQQWVVNLMIEKVNGEKTIYEDTPSNVVQLARVILESLNNFSAEQASGIIDADELKHFKQICDDFFELFAVNVTDQ